MSTVVSDLVIGRPQIRSALSTLAELHQQTEPAAHTVSPTGFDFLDDVLAGGIRQGEVLLLGGKPGVGKTIAVAPVGPVDGAARHRRRVRLLRARRRHAGDAAALGRARRRGRRGAPGGSGVRHDELQARLRDVAAGSITLRQALESDPLLREAHGRLAAYADRLVLVTGSGAHTDVNAIRDLTRTFEGQPVALFVDYVQKVPVFPAVAHEGERVGRVIEGLKQLALDQRVVVIAIAAADQAGLDARRLHLRHFRGSTALAYEADAVVVLNDKLAVVSRAHLAYSPTRAEEFHRQVVFSVEKNRNGSPDVNLEFEKDFGHYRFHPRGRWVAERLWTEGSVEL